jgi:uncharacterized membrane protein
VTVTATPIPEDHYRRFLREAEHLARPFGSGSFGQKAEAFARFFGTPTFLVGQTVVVGRWIALNSIGVVHFDLYPFMLLNLAFSLQAAYAAPLILLAQTRQADRDKAHAEADAKHREAVAAQSLDQQQLAAEGIQLLHRLLDENRALTKRVEALTEEIPRQGLERLTPSAILARAAVSATAEMSRTVRSVKPSVIKWSTRKAAPPPTSITLAVGAIPSTSIMCRDGVGTAWNQLTPVSPRSA